MRENSNIEINGKPGLLWGNLIVPGSGRLKIKIVGDLLHTNTESYYKLEKKDIQTRIQDVKSIEIASGPLSWLLGLGIFTLPWGIGIIFLILYFFIKQNWLIIYTTNISIIVFYKKTQDVEGFRTRVLTLARQLNSPSLPRTPPPVPPRLPGQTTVRDK
ncbi:hypothetical protein FJR11_19840 [Anabaena sp. UHCC 0187]|uniref:hypothetical protein n=1 Tax=Anabaena sp. UHCC 0187 TaxID=2590018 RepID=UPI0014481C28|nr:hypothetical protein [Anabaena sp. UHCC 0187]MTJ14786.1 hypothetical protein [Anabaena sp. UHCC 0187]